MPMAIKPGMVLTYIEGLLPMKSLSRVLARSHDQLQTLDLHYHNATTTHFSRYKNLTFVTL